MRRLTQEIVIERFKKAHPNHKKEYDYSKVKYINQDTRVIIICLREHGEFKQTPVNHWNGFGCKKCSTKEVHKKQRKSPEKYMEEIIKIWKSKYDLSEVRYISNDKRIKVTCYEHGTWYPIAENFRKGHGCKDCGNIESGKKRHLNTIDTILDFKKAHGNKYDYSEIDYVSRDIKVNVICREHGRFPVLASSHKRGTGCPDCVGTKKSNTQDFIKKAKKKHPNVYEYKKVDYEHNKKEVTITCKKHGDFEQIPIVHLRGGGCQDCAGNKALITEDFIKRAREKNGDRYNYSKSVYVGGRTPIIIICPDHGEQLQKPEDHLAGKIPQCCSPSRPIPLEEWKERANKKHYYYYGYDKVGETYKNKDSIVTIICPKHGDFYKHAGTHIGKQRPGGCYFCKTSRGEIIIKNILNKNKINFTYQKKFPDMKYINELECDFYLKDFNTVIEYNGQQHYKANDFFGGINGFIEQKKRDKIKYEYLEKMKIKLIIVKYNISENDVESFILNKLKGE